MPELIPNDFARRETARRRVLDVLLKNEGRWISGNTLCLPEIGGSEGLRRLRELRKMVKKWGWVIEKRRPLEERTTWEYRLIKQKDMDYGLFNCWFKGSN